LARLYTPPVDLEIEKHNADFVRSLIEQGLVNAVHDVSDGGIACAAAEMALASGLSFELNLDKALISEEGKASFHHLLFSEEQARYIVSLPAEHEEKLVALVKALSIDTEEKSTVANIGKVETSDLQILRFQANTDSVFDFTIPLHHIRETHEGWLPAYMSKVD